MPVISLAPPRRVAPRLRSCALLLATMLVGRPAGAIFVEPALNPAAAETPWRFIGVLNVPPPCPASTTPGWTVRPLFPAVLWPVLPDLAFFCLYEWAGPPPAGPPGLPAVFSQLYADRMAVTPMADTLGPELWPTFAERFELYAGATPLPIVSARPPVPLVVLDTSPSPESNPQSLPESSPHGRTLQAMLRRLSCTAAGCWATVTPRLALAYTQLDLKANPIFVRNDIQGGHFGTIGELAEAIALELAKWLAQGGSAPAPVLNLSVAWDPIYGGSETDPKTMLPDVQAVYRALEAAACQGAIVVAAAGNLGDRRGQNTGAMLPAAWTERLLPPGPGCPRSGDPMLYAVGGVRATGEPLANARPQGAPLLAAYGDHATVEDPDDPGTPTPVLTGSSVAAALVSAAAASVLYYRPSLSPLEVMTLVLDSGLALGRAADLCLGGSSCGPVRWVSVCAAAARACLGRPCQSQIPPCRPLNLPAAEIPEHVLASFSPAQVLASGAFAETYPTTSVCGSELPAFLPELEPVDPCPSFQRYGSAVRPWLVPQPNQDPCPNCLVVKKPETQPSGGTLPMAATQTKSAAALGTLYLEIDPQFEGRLSDATLTLCPDTAPVVYNLETGEPLATLELTELPVGDCTTALLSFTLDGSQSLTVPILVSD